MSPPKKSSFFAKFFIICYDAYIILCTMDTADYILLSELNDFIFCPRSIFYHHIYGKFDQKLYHEAVQTRWTHTHESIDQRKYSRSNHILQWVPVISHEFWIQWKIDLYNTRTGILTERKRTIKKVYTGYIWQLYGQYFCLTEMGYIITGIRLYSFTDRTTYLLALPNAEDRKIFTNMIHAFKNFSLNTPFTANPKKCKRCIYKHLCDKNPLS